MVASNRSGADVVENAHRDVKLPPILSPVLNCGGGGLQGLQGEAEEGKQIHHFRGLGVFIRWEGAGRLHAERQVGLTSVIQQEGWLSWQAAGLAGG